MYVLRTRNLNTAFCDLADRMLKEGKFVGPRGMGTKELHPVVVEFNQPRERFVSLIGRGNNPFHTIYETMWVFAGRSDIKYLEYYLPRASDFSDDGKTWRGGYGPRLFNWPGRHGSPTINQINEVCKYLDKDNYTRHAVIEIWDPALEVADLKTADRPCSNYLHLMYRDGALDLMVIMRSNDLWWGFSSMNVFEWSFLQEYIASYFGWRVGKLYYIADSFHIYEGFIPKLNDVMSVKQVDIYNDLHLMRLLKGFDEQKVGYLNSERTWPGFMSEKFNYLTKYIDLINIGIIKPTIQAAPEFAGNDIWLADAFKACIAYKHYKEELFNKALEAANSIQSLDMRIVCLEYLLRGRRLEDIKNNINMILSDLQPHDVFKEFLRRSLKFREERKASLIK